MESHYQRNPRVNADDEGYDRMRLDLLFDLAAGAPAREGFSYEDQLQYYKNKVMPDDMTFQEVLDYGQAYKLVSRHIFPARPEVIRKRSVFIRFFATYIVLKNACECRDYSVASDYESLQERVNAQLVLDDQEDENTFRREVFYLSREYARTLTRSEYEQFTAIMENNQAAFQSVYDVMLACAMKPAKERRNQDTRPAKSAGAAFMTLIRKYQIPEEQATEFHLVLDAVAEVTSIKNDHFDYMQEFQDQWETRCPQYPYGKELEDYLHEKQSSYIMTHGAKLSVIHNDNMLLSMLAEITVKLALLEGVRTVRELAMKVKDMTSNLGNGIVGSFIGCRRDAISNYGLDRCVDLSVFAQPLIPFRSDLLYLKDLLEEEIRFRDKDNIVDETPVRGSSGANAGGYDQLLAQKKADAKEYELQLAQKDEEIFELRQDLAYYENIKQQDFRAEVSQYNKALIDLFTRLCDEKYGSPLNQLYLFANNLKAMDPGTIRGYVQNMMFILGTMNITPYETGNVGKKVRFMDDEANIVYAVNEKKVAEGMNTGLLKFPGWKYKDTELVLPHVDMGGDQ